MKKNWKRRMVSLVLFVLLVAGLNNNVFAQSYPTKPIRILVGFAAGGVADILARTISVKLGEILGQPVVVEIRAGAGSNIAAETVAKSPPDGYTLFIYATANAVNVSLYSKLSYDLIKDFVPVTPLASMANVLVVNPLVPAKSVKELIALAKSKPGQLQYASSGYGSTQHLSGELFKMMAGIDIVQVLYKGSVPAMTAVVGGEVPMVFQVMSTALPQIRADKVRALGLTSAKRSPFAPEIPTIAEAGLLGYENITSFGVLAPAGTPKEIISKLNAEISKILKMPAVKERLASNGAEVMSSTPDQFLKFIKEEIDNTGKLIKQSGARVD